MPGQPVILDTLGGLVSSSRPEDLPEGASPRTQDTDFIVGRVIQRPGEQNAYSYEGGGIGPNGGSNAADVPNATTPWTNVNNILANDGSYATVSLGLSAFAITSIEGLQYTESTAPGWTHNYLIVTFDRTLPAGGQYSFSGLTAYTLLNAKVLSPVALAGIPPITLAANQAAFLFGNTQFPNTPETGAAGVTYPSYLSDAIDVKGFGFSVASTADITGVVVNIKGFGAGATVFAQLLNAGVPVGVVESIPLPTTVGTVTLGSPTDMWGSTWNYLAIDATTFGVRIWVEAAAPVSVSLDYVSIAVWKTPEQANFNGLMDANINGQDQITLALDAAGQTWEEDVTNNPNVLAIQSLIPAVQPGSYLKGVDANGTAYMAYSDLITGTSPPMQFNGQWCDRITQVGPGAPPQFTASTEAGAQASVTAYSASGGVLTLTAVNTFTAGLLVTFSGFTGGLVPLNGLTFSVLGTGLSGTQFEISTSLVTGAGSDAGIATPQFTYPIVASPLGIVQPPQMSDPDAPGHVNSLLWSSGPGSKTPGNVITVYYSNSFTHPNPDTVLVDAFNAGNPVYVYIKNQPFGNGVWQVTSVGNAIPPGGAYYRWYFTYQVPTSSYQQYGGPDDALGTYQVTQATLTTTVGVPGLAAGNQVSLAGVTNSGWDGLYNIVQALNSGSFAITQTQLTAGVATYTWALQSGSAPKPGQLVTVTNTLNDDGLLNVVDAVIATATGVSTGTFTVNGFSTATDFPVAVESGQATTAGTEFIIDPGAAEVGSVTANPIIGNSGGGTLTVVGAAGGGTFPIGPGTRQGTVFFITRNGAVTRPAPPSVFTVVTGSNYITASNIPLGPENVVARGIAFTEAGQNGVPGANFYTYSIPVIFTVNGVQYTASALIVPDNTTTTMKFTFSDAVLLSSDEIDIEGNNYFNLIEIGDPAWMFQYADRMLYGLCRTKIQNFLNMSFDGGYLPTNGLTLPQPLGWKNTLSGNPSVPIPITSFSITSNVVSFAAVNRLIVGDLVLVSGLSIGTYLNGLVFTVTAATGTTFSANFTHADVGVTADSGSAGLIDAQDGLVTSPIFGNAFQYVNQSSVTLHESVLLFQSAYQDSYNVPILQPNTAYSVRLTGRGLNGTCSIYVALLTYQNGIFGSTNFGSATFTLAPGAMVTQTQPFGGTTPATIPIGLILAIGIGTIAPGVGFQIDRIDVFPTNHPVDETTIWTSYANNFEAIDGVTGSLGVGSENAQPAVGSCEIIEQLYINKTRSRLVTQDSPNYEPNQWQTRQVSDSGGCVGINAFDEQEEFMISAPRIGLEYFDGGKPMPMMRELQASGVRGSIWELVNWNAAKTIWVKNDLLGRKLYIGLPMNTPNFYLPNVPAATPTSPNVILICNYTGCPTGDELAQSSQVHVTMFGDMKALDMRRKWSLWNIACPAAEFIMRPDGTRELFLCNGTGSSKIYRLVNGAPDASGQNTDDGAAINGLYTTYGFTKAKQGMMQPGLGALRKVWYYMTATMEGMGQLARKFYVNTLGALPQNTYTAPPATLTYPAQNDQECVLEIGGQRVFVEFSSIGSGGYWELGPVMLDGEMDKQSPHRGVSS